MNYNKMLLKFTTRSYNTQCIVIYTELVSNIVIYYIGCE